LPLPSPYLSSGEIPGQNVGTLAGRFGLNAFFRLRAFRTAAGGFYQCLVEPDDYNSRFLSRFVVPPPPLAANARTDCLSRGNVKD